MVFVQFRYIHKTKGAPGFYRTVRSSLRLFLHNTSCDCMGLCLKEHTYTIVQYSTELALRVESYVVSKKRLLKYSDDFEASNESLRWMTWAYFTLKVTIMLPFFVRDAFGFLTFLTQSVNGAREMVSTNFWTVRTVTLMLRINRPLPWQRVPWYPIGHSQCSPRPSSMHVPPFSHRTWRQGSSSEIQRNVAI